MTFDTNETQYILDKTDFSTSFGQAASPAAEEAFKNGAPAMAEHFGVASYVSPSDLENATVEPPPQGPGF